MNIFTSILAYATMIAGTTGVPAPGDIEPDYSDHPGKTTILQRDCEAFYLEAYEAINIRSYGSVVEMTEGDDGNIYFRFMVSEYPCESYVKAERVGETIRINGPQVLYTEYDYDKDEPYNVYLMPMEVTVVDGYNTFTACEDMQFVFNIDDDGSLVSADPQRLLGVCTYTYLPYQGEKGYYWTGYGDRNITISEITSEPVEIPDGLTPENWVWEDPYETAAVKVMFHHDEIFIAGMDRSLTDTWVKGTIKGDKVEFPSGQYLGPDMGQLYLHYFCGAATEVKTDEEGDDYTDISLLPSAVFNYDPEKRILTSETPYLINSSPSVIFPLTLYTDVTVEDQHRNPDTLPAPPYDADLYTNDFGDHIWVMIPNRDIDGNLLDEDKLYYEIFFNGEPYELDIYYPGIEEHPTWIPYLFQNDDIYVYKEDHTIYFYADGVDSFGIRNIYVNENGKVLYSEGVGDAAGVMNVERQPESVEWYDLTGRRLNNPAKGIVIRKTRYSDGSSETRKTIIR